MPPASGFIRVPIDAAMRERAHREQDARRVNRTRASPMDSYLGVLGELAWAKLRYADISDFDTLGTKGRVDDANTQMTVEVKTSKTAIHDRTHLMVREDYARARQPDIYVLILVPEAQLDGEETVAFACGWAKHDEVISGPLVERRSHKTGAAQGYRCHEIVARDLRALSTLPFALAGLYGAGRQNNTTADSG